MHAACVSRRLLGSSVPPAATGTTWSTSSAWSGVIVWPQRGHGVHVYRASRAGRALRRAFLLCCVGPWRRRRWCVGQYVCQGSRGVNPWPHAGQAFIGMPAPWAWAHLGYILQPRCGPRGPTVGSLAGWAWCGDAPPAGARSRGEAFRPSCWFGSAGRLCFAWYGLADAVSTARAVWFAVAWRGERFGFVGEGEGGHRGVAVFASPGEEPGFGAGVVGERHGVRGAVRPRGGPPHRGVVVAEAPGPEALIPERVTFVRPDPVDLQFREPAVADGCGCRRVDVAECDAVDGDDERGAGRCWPAAGAGPCPAGRPDRVAAPAGRPVGR